MTNSSTPSEPSKPDSPIEERGFRVRVVYPIIVKYRYVVYSNAQDWRVAERSVATIFATEAEADDAVQVINADKDVKAVGGSAAVEPIQSFDPDWCLAPGVHIQEQLKYLNMSEEEMAQKLGLTKDRFKVLLAGGDEFISSDLAEKLFTATGAPAAYWYNLENRYREGIRMGLTVTT